MTNECKNAWERFRKLLSTLKEVILKLRREREELNSRYIKLLNKETALRENIKLLEVRLASIIGKKEAKNEIEELNKQIVNLQNELAQVLKELEEVNRLIDKVTLNVGKTANYKLRVWLNFDGLTDEEKEALVGQKIFLTLKINGIQNVILDNLDTSGASVPVLASNMIPVYYDGTTWRKADSTNSNETYKWYDYEDYEDVNAILPILVNNGP